MLLTYCFLKEETGAIPSIEKYLHVACSVSTTPIFITA
jgi:hypothetical protein